MPTRGLHSPVIVPGEIDWRRDYSSTTLADLLGMSDDELATVDPLAVNLIVAKGIPSLADLDIARYQEMVNHWTLDFTERCLPRWEPYFHESPQDFDDDIRFFRLGMLHQYLELEAGIEYNLDQRDGLGILYTNPSDLFLNGVLDTHQGTCGNMAALNHAMGWRLGWPVSLACVKSHYILRFDDGETVFNIEATQVGYGGFKSDPDDFLIKTKQLPPVAIECGSDLRALRPREVLGTFIGLRARHLRDVGMYERCEAKTIASEPDWLLARQLFPTNRVLYRDQLAVTSMRGDHLFEPDETGHPNTYATCLAELSFHRDMMRGTDTHIVQQMTPDAIDELFFKMEINP